MLQPFPRIDCRPSASKLVARLAAACATAWSLGLLVIAGCTSTPNANGFDSARVDDDTRTRFEHRHPQRALAEASPDQQRSADGIHGELIEPRAWDAGTQTPVRAMAARQDSSGRHAVPPPFERVSYETEVHLNPMVGQPSGRQRGPDPQRVGPFGTHAATYAPGRQASGVNSANSMNVGRPVAAVAQRSTFASETPDGSADTVARAGLAEPYSSRRGAEPIREVTIDPGQLPSHPLTTTMQQSVQSPIRLPLNQGTPSPLENPAAVPPNGTEAAQSGESQVPLESLPGAESVEIDVRGELINLHVRSAPLNAVLTLLADELDLSMVIASDVTDAVSITLHQAPLENALDSLVAIAGCSWSVRGGIIHVAKISSTNGMSATVQGLELRVFNLNFASAADVQLAVDGLLSPRGQSFITESESTNQRRTRDQLIVEDFPGHVARIEQFVAQMDQPPQQVVIQAYVLQVTLGDETRHGVNFDYLQGLGGFEKTTIGFANPLAAPATFLSLDGGNIDALIELIKNTTDAKTLASPRVQVISGQQARIQIGERLGFLVTTTTETSTLQDVQFLEVGVVLEVTPTVTSDGQVVMQVMPKISGGQVLDGLPQEETTEVNTTVMLPDGRGIVIGGLIQEFDDDRQAKLPILGDLWLVGRLFQRRTKNLERRETIVALVPQVVPYGGSCDPQHQVDWERSSTPLIHPSLDRVFRPWEPSLPDAMEDPRRFRYDRFPSAIPNLRESHPNPPHYYAPRASRNDKYSNLEVIGRPTYGDIPMSYDYSSDPFFPRPVADQ